MKRYLSLLWVVPVLWSIACSAFVALFSLWMDAQHPLDDDSRRIFAMVRQQLHQRVPPGGWTAASRDDMERDLNARLCPDTESGRCVVLRDFPPGLILRFGLPPADGFALRRFYANEQFAYVASWAPQPVWQSEGSLLVYPLTIAQVLCLWCGAVVVVLAALVVFVLKTLSVDADPPPSKDDRWIELGAMAVSMSWPLALLLRMNGSFRSEPGAVEGYLLVPLVPLICLVVSWLLLALHTRWWRPTLRALAGATVGAALALGLLLAVALVLGVALLLVSLGKAAFISERVFMLAVVAYLPFLAAGAWWGGRSGWCGQDVGGLLERVLTASERLRADWPGWALLGGGLLSLLGAGLAAVPMGLHL